MIDRIKKETFDLKQTDIDSLSNYRKSKINKIEIVDSTVDGDTFRDIYEEQKLLERQQKYSRDNYPWEEENRDLSNTNNIYNNGDLGIQSTQLVRLKNTKTSRKKTITKSPSGEKNEKYLDDRVIFKADGQPFDKNNSKEFVGKYGTFRASKMHKNAPLIFVVGGVVVNGQNPGTYMWNYGFSGLSNFNIYNCKTAYNSGEAWNECVKILTENGITINNKILVGYSAGAATMYSGVLKQRSAENWDIIHIAGPTIKTQSSCEFHLSLINQMGGRVYYIQAYGPKTTSEGADRLFKEQIANKLESENIINSSGHPDTARKSAQWIGNNIIFNKEFILKSRKKGTTWGSSSDSPPDKKEAKEKGSSGNTKKPLAKGNNLPNTFKLKPASTIITTTGHVVGSRYKVLPGTEHIKNIGDRLERIKGGDIPFDNGKVDNNYLKSLKGNESYMLYHTAADAFNAMYDAAKKDGITLRVGSAYRNYSHQKTLWDNHHLRDEKQRRRFVAPPGGSNHGLGKAIDVKPGGSTSTNGIDTYGNKKWINLNGDRFGWYWGDAPDEDWHFVYVY